jgi:hypothetical protein
MKLPTTIPFLCLVLISMPGLQADAIFLTPEEDSFIQGGSLGMEIRRNGYLEVAARGASEKSALRKIFLAFDVEKNVAAKVASTRLVLSYRTGSTIISSEEGDKTPVTLALFGGVGENWSEENLTWDEAPMHDKSSATERNNTLVTLLAEQTVDPAAPDFGSSMAFADDKLTEFIRRNPGRFTLIVTCEGSPSMPGLRFFDKDGTKDPELKPTLILEMK